MLRLMKGRIFGELLREARVEKGISLRELSVSTGIDYTRLSRMEHGTRPAPDLEMMRTMSRVLSIPLLELLVAAGTSREVVEALLWEERLNLGEALPELGAYQPEASPLLDKNTFRAAVESRQGARCSVSLGGETLRVLSFSARDALRIQIPPEAVVVFRRDPTAWVHGDVNVLRASVEKVRQLGQVTNLVLSCRGFQLNVLMTSGGQGAGRAGCAQTVYALIPVAAIRTRPAEEEE